jgi:hypothetical protein
MQSLDRPCCYLSDRIVAALGHVNELFLMLDGRHDMVDLGNEVGSARKLEHGTFTAISELPAQNNRATSVIAVVSHRS